MLARSQSYKLYGIAERYFNDENIVAQVVNEVENFLNKRTSTEEYQLLAKDDLSKMMNDLRVEMKEQKAEMIKWMFLFWIGQIAATLAIVLILLKKRCQHCHSILLLSLQDVLSFR